MSDPSPTVPPSPQSEPGPFFGPLTVGAVEKIGLAGCPEVCIYDDAAPSGSKMPAIALGWNLDLALARARVFASAPDLLAACKALLPHVEGMIERANPDHEDTSQYSDQTAVRLARAAIAKAGGAA